MKYVFPAWLYHKTKGAKIFENAEEVEAAGEGWFDTPAAFEVSEPEAVVPAKTYKEHMADWPEKAKKEKPVKKEKGEA